MQSSKMLRSRYSVHIYPTIVLLLVEELQQLPHTLVGTEDWVKSVIDRRSRWGMGVLLSLIVLLACSFSIAHSQTSNLPTGVRGTSDAVAGPTGDPTTSPDGLPAPGSDLTGPSTNISGAVCRRLTGVLPGIPDCSTVENPCFLRSVGGEYLSLDDPVFGTPPPK